MELRPYRKIKELEFEIERLKRENKYYADEEKERKEREQSGKHLTSLECIGCKYHINTNFGFLCMKDCECEDWEE